MKTIILAGGLGSRMREETEYKPKPMVEIGGKPILWHIMMNYNFYKQKEFIVCMGYKKESIIEYFLDFDSLDEDISINLNQRKHLKIKNKLKEYKNFIKNNFEYVGENFAYEARSIHYKTKKKEKGIYGKASIDEVKELSEEGIETEVVPWINDKEN